MIPKRLIPGAKVTVDDLSTKDRLSESDERCREYDLIFASEVF